MSAVLSPQFVIGSIRIGSVTNASCINMGNNLPAGFENHQKLTQGFGSVNGDRTMINGIRSLLNDSDFLDMLNISNSEVPEWLQKMIISANGNGTEFPDVDVQMPERK
jgi:hypothetical protein